MLEGLSFLNLPKRWSCKGVCVCLLDFLAGKPVMRKANQRFY